jgi:hypothetical protein
MQPLDSGNYTSSHRPYLFKSSSSSSIIITSFPSSSLYGGREENGKAFQGASGRVLHSTYVEWNFCKKHTLIGERERERSSNSEEGGGGRRRRKVLFKNEKRVRECVAKEKSSSRK